MSRNICFLGLLTLALAAGGCGDDGPPAPPELDASRPDTNDSEDAGTPDVPSEDDAGDAGADDTGPVDAGTDAGFDVGPFDANFPDMGPPEPMVVCGPDTPRSMCRANCRDDGFSCVDAFCDGRECVPGAPCTENAHCGSGTCIIPDDAAPEDSGLCEPSTGGCTGISDCAHGFRCEMGSCVDRRIPCGFHENSCPRGYTCTFAPVEGSLFCVPALTPCESAGQCEAGARCVDVDGDTTTECVPSGLCTSNEDCAEGLSCGVDPGTSQSSCQPDGPCRDGMCPAGSTCLDTGVGTARCVAEGGTCTSDSECDPQAVCGAIDADDPLRCLTFDEESR